MCKFKKISGLLLILIIGGAMLVQIFYGFRWMSVNFHAFPLFGDSTEYLNLSQSLLLDEYRPILYPLFLRGILALSERWLIEAEPAIYLIQTLVSAAAIFYSVNILLKGFGLRRIRTPLYWLSVSYITLYVLCIPMITFMNFSVLTDSLSVSGLIVVCAALVSALQKDKLPITELVLITLCMLLEFLVRADRLYNCTLFLLISFSIILLKKKRAAYFKKTAVCMLLGLAVSIGLSGVVNKLTQRPGVYGRVHTNLAFVLLDRVVWSNMSANYADFPQEIQEVIPFADALLFDSHNNNVMYQMAPQVISSVGQEKADKYFKTMAQIVFRNQPGKVLGDIAEDFLCVMGTPVSVYRHFQNGKPDMASSWNLSCVSVKDEALTKQYNQYYLKTFLCLLAFAVLVTLYCLIRDRKKTGKLFQNLWPHLLICLILALWFSVGDGAPPNDRYALIHYITWAYWVLGCISQSLNALIL